MKQTVSKPKEKNPLPPDKRPVTGAGVSGGPALGPMKHREAAIMRHDDEGPVPEKPDTTSKSESNKHPASRSSQTRKAR